MEITKIQPYVDAGYTVMPVNGKVPVLKKWTAKPYSPIVKDEEYPANFGIILQEEDLVIDVDPRNFPKGAQPFVDFCTEIGHNPAKVGTFVVRTGGGGVHIYLKKNKKIDVVHMLKKYPGIEFCSKGQYVVGVGSVHPDTGKRYEIIEGSPENVAEVQPKLLKLIHKQKTNIVKKEDIQTDSETAKTRFKEYLKKVEPATEGNFGDKHTFKVACRGKDMGLSLDSVYTLMETDFNPKCVPVWPQEELYAKVKNAYSYSEGSQGNDSPQADFDNAGVSESQMLFDRGERGLKKTLSNCVKYFTSKESKLRGCFSYNAFSKEITIQKQPPWDLQGKVPQQWTDGDAIEAKFYLSDVKKFEISKDMVHEAAYVTAKQKMFHPVLEYLNSLPKWDGVDRSNWLSLYCGVKETPYIREIARKTLIAAVRRIKQPGCMFHTMLVLEGRQGIGKSQACHILGGEFTGDVHLDPHNKDTVAAIQPYWLIDVSEMVCARKADVEALKSFLSRQFDTVRPAYGRTMQKFYRQCVFIGTINPEADKGYLRDTTGNRRFWPATCHDFDLPGLTRDRNQIWAQAVYMEKQNETIYLDKKEIREMALKEQKQREVRDPWTDRIMDWVETNEIMQITTADVYMRVFDGRMINYSRRDQIRISNILQNDMGWIRKVYRDYNTGKSVRGYVRYGFLET